MSDNPHGYPTMADWLAMNERMEKVERFAKSEMVDRVAAAWMLAEIGVRWEDAYDGARERYRSWARKAVEAMREPTAAMVEANGCCELTREQVAEGWRAMIDAALR